MRRRQLKRGRNSKRTAAANRFDRKINRFKTAIERKTHHPDVNKLLPFLNERIAFKMPSDIAYLDQVLDYITERMLDLGIIGPGDSEVLVALDEAIVNAIKHGNKSDPRKAVHIVAEMNAGGARFTVRDEGCGFAQRDVPDPTEPARLLKPSGRGLLLIKHIMDEVCYNECGNEISMFKRATHKPRRKQIDSRRDALQRRR